MKISERIKQQRSSDRVNKAKEYREFKEDFSRELRILADDIVDHYSKYHSSILHSIFTIREFNSIELYIDSDTTRHLCWYLKDEGLKVKGIKEGEEHIVLYVLLHEEY